MPGTGSRTEALLLDVAPSLRDRPTLPVHLLASMRCGVVRTVAGAHVRRLHHALWEFRRPGRSGSVMVGHGQDGVDEYGAQGWRVVEYGDEPPVTLDETHGVEAALSVALDWASQ